MTVNKSKTTMPEDSFVCRTCDGDSYISDLSISSVDSPSSKEFSSSKNQFQLPAYRRLRFISVRIAA